jgi:hypothetical protein
MSAEWYMLPEARKYLETDESNSANPVPASNGALHPPSSHHPLSPLELQSPDPNGPGQMVTPQGIPPVRNVEDALREWHLTNQQVRISLSLSLSLFLFLSLSINTPLYLTGAEKAASVSQPASNQWLQFCVLCNL